MEQKSKLRLCVLGAALATTAVFAGTYATLEESTLTTAQRAPVATESDAIVAAPQEAVPASEPVNVAESAPTPSSESAPVAAPMESTPTSEPPITVTEQRLTEDQRIQGDVMDKLAHNDTLSGKVGVESMDRIVRLSG